MAEQGHVHAAEPARVDVVGAGRWSTVMPSAAPAAPRPRPARQVRRGGPTQDEDAADDDLLHVEHHDAGAASAANTVEVTPGRSGPVRVTSTVGRLGPSSARRCGAGSGSSRASTLPARQRLLLWSSRNATQSATFATSYRGPLRPTV